MEHSRLSISFINESFFSALCRVCRGNIFVGSILEQSKSARSGSQGLSLSGGVGKQGQSSARRSGSTLRSNFRWAEEAEDSGVRKRAANR